MKPGSETTEFKQTAIVNVITAIVALLAAYGLITNSDAGLWVQLGQAIVALVMPMVMAYVTTRYANGRVALKTEALRSMASTLEVSFVSGDEDDDEDEGEDAY